MSDVVLEQSIPALADVPGVAAVVLGGSRARGTAGAASDYDIGLYFSRRAPLDTGRLLEIVKTVVDDPDAAAVTPIGGWGPRIVGGGWLRIAGHKVDLLYRCLEDVGEVMQDCRAGKITMSYQPGHPHGFCSAIWMGEVALCRPLHDPHGAIARLKEMAEPFPDELRAALTGRFAPEVAFGIANAEIAVPRREQTQIAGCAYQALGCMGQVLFALNRRYLINEKGALSEAAHFPLTIRGLPERVAAIWGAIGGGQFGAAIDELRRLDGELQALVKSAS